MALNVWILFHSALDESQPETYEIFRLLDEGRKMGLSIKVVQAGKFDMVLDGTGNWNAYYDGDPVTRPDFIITRTGAETDYNAFALMRFYERLGVTLVNTLRAIEKTTDKLFTQKILTSRDLPMPKTMMGRMPPDIDLVEREFGFPLVIKVLRGTRGRGVILCETRDQFRDTMDLISDMGKDVQMLFQQYIASSHGRDVRVFVVEGKVLASMQRQSAGTSFKSNVSLGGEGSAFTATPEMERIAIAAARELGLTVAGVDLLVGDDGPIVCEVNSAPGFQGLEKATGVNAAKAILDVSLKTYRARTGASLGDRAKSWLKNPFKAL